MPIWSVRCVCRLTTAEAQAKPEVLEVNVPSLTDLAAVLVPFEVVTFTGLTARPWAMVNDGRGNDGVTFSATGVSMVKAGRNGGSKAPAEPVPVSAS